jgi:hypothetical protein
MKREPGKLEMERYLAVSISEGRNCKAVALGTKQPDTGSCPKKYTTNIMKEKSGV